MPISFTTAWRNYKKVTEQIEAAQAQLELFPGRQSTKLKLKELREQLFNDYEGFLNSNNQINEYAARSATQKWFSSNCRVLNANEVSDWIDKQDFKKNNIVRYIADDSIGKSMCELCFKGGTPYCPQVKGDETGCATSLVKEIVKSSERYTSIPNTEKNFQMFMNGATQYLDKNVNSQDSSEDSPIEEIMFEALKPVAKRLGYRIQREYPIYDEGRMELRYSLDIVFIDDGSGRLLLDVETDGLTFHSGYNQMASDRARDRWLLIRGVPTMRFTSREIFSDLDNCIIQVESALESLYERKNKQKNKKKKGR